MSGRRDDSHTMGDDSHYIPNSRNAHIDTSSFESELLGRFRESDRDSSFTLESIYNHVLSITNIKPTEPTDDQLVCRYLPLNRFLHFLHTREIFFPQATQLADHWECRIPEDYENATLKVLAELDVPAKEWSDFVQIKKAEWNVSCWTAISEHFDNYLLWHAYAGGADGVGITVRYGVLKHIVAEAAETLDLNGLLYSGYVSYGKIGLLPFCKHPIFRDEKEVRLAFRGFQVGPMSVSIEEVFNSFRVRISSAASHAHYEMIHGLWSRYDGRGEIEWPTG